MSSPSAVVAPTPAEEPSTGTLYERDFYAWTQQQARLLQAGDYARVDLPNLVEEVETLGRTERAILASAYRLVALHLLKLVVQKERKSRSWLGTIARERINAARALRENPSLKPQRAALFARAYEDARKEAVAETGLPPSAFPAEPPFTLAQLEDEAYLPGV